MVLTFCTTSVELTDYYHEQCLRLKAELIKNDS